MIPHPARNQQDIKRKYVSIGPREHLHRPLLSPLPFSPLIGALIKGRWICCLAFYYYSDGVAPGPLHDGLWSSVTLERAHSVVQRRAADNFMQTNKDCHVLIFFFFSFPSSFWGFHTHALPLIRMGRAVRKMETLIFHVQGKWREKPDGQQTPSVFVLGCFYGGESWAVSVLIETPCYCTVDYYDWCPHVSIVLYCIVFVLDNNYTIEHKG